MSALQLLTRFGTPRAATGGGGAAAETGLTAIPGSLSTITNTQQYGWEFTVGASNITVSKLRVYAPSAASRTLRLWQVDTSTTGTLLASVTVTSAADEWVEGALDTPIELTAAGAYAVSEREESGTGVDHYYLTSLTGYEFNPAITFVQSRNVNSNGFPSTRITATHGPRGIADIIFT